MRNEIDHDCLNKIRARINNGVSHESIAKKKRNMEEGISANNGLEREVNDLIVVNSELVKEI